MFFIIIIYNRIKNVSIFLKIKDARVSHTYSENHKTYGKYNFSKTFIVLFLLGSLFFRTRDISPLSFISIICKINHFIKRGDTFIALNFCCFNYKILFLLIMGGLNIRLVLFKSTVVTLLWRHNFLYSGVRYRSFPVESGK